MKFFFSNAPQFAALPACANVPGFGADRKNDNRLFSVQNIHTFGARTVNEARVGYSLVYRQLWATPCKGLGRRHQAGERRRLPGAGADSHRRGRSADHRQFRQLYRYSAQ